jgi:histidine kinase/DNA gyrase B/HSP90-like ATPase
VFSVANRGAEIEPAIQATFFRPFDQLHLLRAPGLGLSFVQRLVALQGGRCRYERLEDGLSAFRFTLPSAAPAVEAQKDPAHPKAIHKAQQPLSTGVASTQSPADPAVSPSPLRRELVAGVENPS